jgi:hypothetical protein
MPKPAVTLDTAIKELDAWRDELQGELNELEELEENEQDEEEMERLNEEISKIEDAISTLESL